jgi:hypothetical protein
VTLKAVVLQTERLEEEPHCHLVGYVRRVSRFAWARGLKEWTGAREPYHAREWQGPLLDTQRSVNRRFKWAPYHHAGCKGEQ